MHLQRHMPAGRHVEDGWRDAQFEIRTRLAHAETVGMVRTAVELRVGDAHENRAVRREFHPHP